MEKESQTNREKINIMQTLIVSLVTKTSKNTHKITPTAWQQAIIQL